jgi:hypothetical protein
MGGSCINLGPSDSGILTAGGVREQFADRQLATTACADDPASTSDRPRAVLISIPARYFSELYE